MTLRRIAKSKMSKTSRKRGLPIVAHLATVGTSEPLCQAELPSKAHWCEEGEPSYRAVRDCKNCVELAGRAGTRVPPTQALL